MEEDLKSIKDYISIGWRRKYFILVPFVLLLTLTIIVVSILPPIYRSQGTVVIESQQISQELVRSTVSMLAEERVHLIVQRIMNTEQLIEIADKYKIFQDQGQNKPRSQLLAEMRKRIQVKITGADGRRIDPNRNSNIAMTISYEDKSPGSAKNVVSELVTLFLDENIRSRTEHVEDTTEFLEKESNRLGAQIEKIESEIANYKQTHEGSLPQTLTINLKRVVDLRSEVLKAEGELSTLEERKNLLLVDLNSLENQTDSVLVDPETKVLKQELKKLQNQFITLSARYGPEHPDVKSAERQIIAFEKEYGNLSELPELLKQKEEVEAEYADSVSKYSKEHPDVKRLGRKLEGVNAMIAQFDKREDEVAEKNINPKILQAKAKLNSVEQSIVRVSRSRREILGQIQELDEKIGKTPQVERGLEALERDYENTKQKYQEIKSKQLQAELSRSLEEDKKGERFVLIEPPRLPDYPVKPKRLQLMVFGLGLSLLCGLGVAAIAESLDSSIRGSRAFATVTKMTPLVTVPYIATSRDEFVRKRNIIIFLGASLVGIVILLLALHHYYKPLDVLWLELAQKLNLI